MRGGASASARRCAIAALATSTASASPRGRASPPALLPTAASASPEPPGCRGGCAPSGSGTGLPSTPAAGPPAGNGCCRCSWGAETGDRGGRSPLLEAARACTNCSRHSVLMGKYLWQAVGYCNINGHTPRIHAEQKSIESSNLIQGGHLGHEAEEAAASALRCGAAVAVAGRAWPGARPWDACHDSRHLTRQNPRTSSCRASPEQQMPRPFVCLSPLPVSVDLRHPCCAAAGSQHSNACQQKLPDRFACRAAARTSCSRCRCSRTLSPDPGRLPGTRCF